MSLACIKRESERGSIYVFHTYLGVPFSLFLFPLLLHITHSYIQYLGSFLLRFFCPKNGLPSIFHIMCVLLGIQRTSSSVKISTTASPFFPHSVHFCSCIIPPLLSLGGFSITQSTYTYMPMYGEGKKEAVAAFYASDSPFANIKCSKYTRMS